MDSKQVFQLTKLRNRKVVEGAPVDSAFRDANLHVTLIFVLDKRTCTR